LRSCNDLLRRLSRADDAVFCGRVFIFVFQCFPLGDKSSVNRVGDYNVDNVTMFDELASQLTATGETATASDPDAMDTSNDPAREADEGGKTQTELSNSLDTDTLHPIFWGMQRSFAHPPGVVKGPETFSEFKRSFEATLTKFQATSKLLSSKSFDRKKDTRRDIEQVEKDDLIMSINPKYLTSRELFDLEVSLSTIVCCKTNLISLMIWHFNATSWSKL
jgi:THO complex subunit 1